MRLLGYIIIFLYTAAFGIIVAIVCVSSSTDSKIDQKDDNAPRTAQENRTAGPNKGISTESTIENPNAGQSTDSNTGSNTQPLLAAATPSPTIVPEIDANKKKVDGSGSGGSTSTVQQPTPAAQTAVTSTGDDADSPGSGGNTSTVQQPTPAAQTAVTSAGDEADGSRTGVNTSSEQKSAPADKTAVLTTEDEANSSTGVNTSSEQQPAPAAQAAVTTTEDEADSSTGGNTSSEQQSARSEQAAVRSAGDDADSSDTGGKTSSDQQSARSEQAAVTSAGDDADSSDSGGKTSSDQQSARSEQAAVPTTQDDLGSENTEEERLKKKTKTDEEQSENESSSADMEEESATNLDLTSGAVKTEQDPVKVVKQVDSETTEQANNPSTSSTAQRTSSLSQEENRTGLHSDSTSDGQPTQNIASLQTGTDNNNQSPIQINENQPPVGTSSSTKDSLTEYIRFVSDDKGWERIKPMFDQICRLITQILGAKVRTTDDQTVYTLKVSDESLKSEQEDKRERSKKFNENLHEFRSLRFKWNKNEIKKEFRLGDDDFRLYYLNTLNTLWDIAVNMQKHLFYKDAIRLNENSEHFYENVTAFMVLAVFSTANTHDPKLGDQNKRLFREKEIEEKMSAWDKIVNCSSERLDMWNEDDTRRFFIQYLDMTREKCAD